METVERLDGHHRMENDWVNELSPLRVSSSAALRLAPFRVKPTEVDKWSQLLGYGHAFLPPIDRGILERNPQCLQVPFITDALSAEVRDCVRKAELDDLVRVVEIPPANLKAQLVRNRLYDSACTTPSCMVCPQCNEEYIGETGRPLWVRVKEHVDGLDKCKLSTPLKEHRLRSHSGAVVGIAVTILAREFDIAARKTLEALWIAFKYPAINRREERVAVTQELAPSADLCGLHPGGRQPKGR
ncbi:unnamed protein product [Heligmosomoides polygyrus]|uniref:Uncharacterized protein n=1 Tax=Heligmosomoides polygyrus TaxID=6339 RepID=A0A183FT98_HELPZ|nr:unnamed protein product [Heligmosomoides polygyrus]